MYFIVFWFFCILKIQNTENKANVFGKMKGRRAGGRQGGRQGRHIPLSGHHWAGTADG